MRVSAAAVATRPADVDAGLPAKQPTPDLPGQAQDAVPAVEVRHQRRGPSAEQVEKAIATLNKTSKAFNTNLQFSVHKATHQIMVKVIRADTGEVIREIPPEKALDALARMEQALGLLVDERR